MWTLPKALRLLILIPFVVIATPLWAGNVTLTWTNATQNEDGSAIPATGDNSLDTTTLEYAACISGQLSAPRLSKTVAASFETDIVSIVTPGDWCFVAFHTNVAGTRSAESNIAIKTILPAVPNPPALLTVTDLVVYTIVKQKDKFVLLAVGRVLAGTACNPNESVNGHYVVPNDAVLWTSATGPRPIVVVAKCA